jgi:SAM-dependent methyltransferase
VTDAAETDAIVPDTKDWTWVLDRACPECGSDASAVPGEAVGAALRANVATWEAVLALPDAAVRPDPVTWSPLEYACHVRDVHRVMGRRLALMLEQDTPTFENWDQDETAAAERYAEQRPERVVDELRVAALEVAGAYDRVGAGEWDRSGVRSNGSVFTVLTLGRYHLHDVVHHAWDVRAAALAATVAAYDSSAAAYAEGTRVVPDGVAAEVDAFVRHLGPGARVLEIGSGPGRDARLLEEAGRDLAMSVRRTDVSPGFVDLLRAEGHDADVLDPLVDDLTDPVGPAAGTAGDGRYDGVWAQACLLHVDRGDLPTVLGRLAAVTRPGGPLLVSVKEGDGDQWSVHGHVSRPRRFVLWREEPLREVVAAAGWEVDAVVRGRGRDGEPWLDVRARRRG